MLETRGSDTHIPFPRNEPAKSCGPYGRSGTHDRAARMRFGMIAADSIFVSASADSLLKIWDVQLMECKQVLRGHTRSVQSIAHSKEYNCLISAGLDQVRLWGTISCVPWCTKPLVCVLPVTFICNAGSSSNGLPDVTADVANVVCACSGCNGMESVQFKKAHLPPKRSSLLVMRRHRGARHTTGRDSRCFRNPSFMGSSQLQILPDLWRQ